MRTAPSKVSINPGEGQSVKRLPTGQAHCAIAPATWRRLVIRHLAPSPTNET